MPNRTLTLSPVPVLRQRFDAVPWLPILLSPRGPYMARTDAQGIPLRDDRGFLHVEETPGGVSGAWRQGARVIANLRWLTPQRNPFDTELDVYGATRRRHGDVDGLSHYPYWTWHFPSPDGVVGFWYKAVASRVLWRILHSAPPEEMMPFATRELAYAWDHGHRVVNAYGAQAALAVADDAQAQGRRPVFLIEDFSFDMDSLIRKALPNAAIQHFIHVPVAPWNVLQLLLTDEWARILTENGQPLGERMLYETQAGWTAADTLMVQRDVDQANLLEAIAQVLGPHGYRVDEKTGSVAHPDGRRSRTTVCPISCDPWEMVERARFETTTRARHAFQDALGGADRVAGIITRIDRTKGIDVALMGFLRHCEHLIASGQIEELQRWGFLAWLQDARSISEEQQYKELIMRLSHDVNDRLRPFMPNERDAVVLRLGNDRDTMTAAFQMVNFGIWTARYGLGINSLEARVADNRVVGGFELPPGERRAPHVPILTGMVGTSRLLTSPFVPRPALDDPKSIAMALRALGEQPADILDQVTEHLASDVWSWNIYSWLSTRLEELEAMALPTPSSGEFPLRAITPLPAPLSLEDLI